MTREDAFERAAAELGDMAISERAEALGGGELLVSIIRTAEFIGLEGGTSLMEEIAADALTTLAFIRRRLEAREEAQRWIETRAEEILQDHLEGDADRIYETRRDMKSEGP